MTDKGRFRDADTTPLSGADNAFNRRDFLRVGGIAVAGIGMLHAAATVATAAATDTTTSPQTAAPVSAPGRKIRIGVVGGRFGTQFQWHEHPNCTVEAVTDLIPDRCDLLARTYNCAKKYPSMEEMLK